MRPFLPAVALVALSFAMPVQAQDLEVGDAGAERDVQLVEWDGDFELLKTSRRLRVWRSHLAYRMEVDAEGQAIGCTIFNEFRRTYVNQKLCDVLTEHHTFAPARDASGTPVAGDYVAKISYMDLRERQ